MRLLLLGGTRFLGYHLTKAAHARGHEVMLFHRGKHAVATAGGAETILGDRNGDLSALARRTWDAVIDTSGYLPRTVRASAEALRDAVERYVFISSLSVYADVSASGIEETAPLATLTSAEVERAHAVDTSGDVYAGTFGNLYGGLKVLCERTAEEILPGRVLTVRPGVIAGPHDYTDRLTYWAVRVARGGEVLAPGPAARLVQFIDARDLAEWIVAMVERRETGVFNATGTPVTMAALLETCRAVSGSDARFRWASEEFLLGRDVKPWTEMPLWLADEPHRRGFMAVSSAKAVAAGLCYRPLEQTIRDLLQEPVDRPLRAGLPPERERQLLAELS